MWIIHGKYNLSRLEIGEIMAFGKIHVQTECFMWSLSELCYSFHTCNRCNKFVLSKSPMISLRLIPVIWFWNSNCFWLCDCVVRDIIWASDQKKIQMGTILNSAMTEENNNNNALPSCRHYPALPAPSASHSQIMSRTSQSQSQRQLEFQNQIERPHETLSLYMNFANMSRPTGELQYHTSAFSTKDSKGYCKLDVT
jgi:hypothetical protein